MKIRRWILLGLFMVACNDDPIATLSESPRYTPPVPPESFKKIYRRSEEINLYDHYLPKQGFYQGEYFSWEDGKIKAHKNGIIECSGQIIDYTDYVYYGGIQDAWFSIYIDGGVLDGNTTIIKTKKHGNFRSASFKSKKYNVKKGQKLEFSSSKDTRIKNLTIYFKPNKDKGAERRRLRG